MTRRCFFTFPGTKIYQVRFARCLSPPPAPRWCLLPPIHERQPPAGRLGTNKRGPCRVLVVENHKLLTFVKMTQLEVKKCYEVGDMNLPSYRSHQKLGKSEKLTTQRTTIQQPVLSNLDEIGAFFDAICLAACKKFHPECPFQLALRKP